MYKIKKNDSESVRLSIYSWVILSLCVFPSSSSSSLTTLPSYHEAKKVDDMFLSSSSTSKEVWIPVEMWNEDGEILLDSNKHNRGPPRYLVGKAASATPACRSLDRTHNDSDSNNSRERQKNMRGSFATKFHPSTIQHFTFDLGNPGDTTFLVDGCRGCTPPNVDINDDKACPHVLPSCNRRVNEKDDANDICWPSRSDEYWTLNSECDIQEAPKESFQCHVEIEPSKRSQHNFLLPDEYKDDYDEYDYKRVCMMCFDGGNHSRYFVPSQSSSLIFFKENDKNPSKSINSQGNNENSDYIDKYTDASDDYFYKLPKNFKFGALIRTIPLQDRIWSNVGIGYNSSFFQQTEISSIQFSFHKKYKSSSDGTSVTGTAHHVIFNPSSNRYIHASNVASQTYETPHQRIHHLDGFKIGESNDLLNGYIHEYTNKMDTMISSMATTTKTVADTAIECFMDTGNGGIFVAQENLRRQLAEATGGYWKSYEDGVESTTKQLIVPHYINNTNIVPDLHVIFTPGIQVTMKNNMWVPDRETGRTIFVSTSDNYTILGLPFISSGLDLVFDDKLKTLYLFGENVKKNELNKKHDNNSNKKSFILSPK